jgi:alginate O-acetyltransferase complex protein AlgI
MSFISFEFIMFFCIVVPLYFVLPMRWRILLLLVSSYIFYAFSRVEYVLLIAFSTLVDYFAARELGKTPDEHKVKRRLLLTASILVNLGVLFVFKYFNFFSESLLALSQSIGFDYQPITHNLLLPVGISFYTFQSMAYTIDVYRKKIDVEYDAAIFATYVAFFPQLVAGPIERAQNMMPQFRKKFNFDYERVVSGLRLVLWGAFKKIVIADRLAVYVNAVYNDVDTYSGLPLILATLFFTFQIYCDFSGYSDIAIGAARVMGFDLMENFRQPYFARSIRDFWRRWHISLSTWFRDYLYFPIGGNRMSTIRNLLNLMIVFVVSGLWHGANWTFVIWGALHGGYIVIETLAIQVTGKREPQPIQLWLQRAVTFLLVVFAWIFFRANTVGDAFYIIQNLFNFSDGRDFLLRPLYGAAIDVRIEFFLSLGLIAFLMTVEWANMRWQLQKFSLRWIGFRWALYYVATAFIIFALLSNNAEQQFIYFQF